MNVGESQLMMTSLGHAQCHAIQNKNLNCTQEVSGLIGITLLHEIFATRLFRDF